MTTISPTEYNNLPEELKQYWKAISEYVPGSAFRQKAYTPVLISLADCLNVVTDRKNKLVEQYKEIQPNSREFDILAHSVMELRIVINELKNLK